MIVSNVMDLLIQVCVKNQMINYFRSIYIFLHLIYDLLFYIQHRYAP